jgi:hypothetical protein
VVRLAASFCYDCLLEEIRQFRNFPVIILMMPRVGEDKVTITVLSIAELYPESSSLIDGALGEVGRGTEVLAMEREGEGNSKKEDE